MTWQPIETRLRRCIRCIRRQRKRIAQLQAEREDARSGRIAAFIAGFLTCMFLLLILVSTK